jgi:hypothetical protein
MKVVEMLKGNSSLLETNCHMIENFHVWQKIHRPLKEGLATQQTLIIQVEDMPLIGGLCHAADFDQV